MLNGSPRIPTIHVYYTHTRSRKHTLYPLVRKNQMAEISRFDVRSSSGPREPLYLISIIIS